MCKLEEIKVTIGPEFASESTTSLSEGIRYKNSEKQVDTFIDIGPSECNQSRCKRSKETECLWSKINVKEFVNGLFRPSLLFVREALSCYQNGAFLGATIMCRSAVESLLFTAVYSNFNAGCCEIKFDPPKNYAIFKKVINCAVSKGYLNEDHHKWLLERLNPSDPEVGIVRYNGDLVAHYTEKIIKNNHRGNSGQSNKQDQCQENIWINEKISYKILEKSIEILTYVNQEYKKANKIN